MTARRPTIAFLASALLSTPTLAQETLYFWEGDPVDGYDYGLSIRRVGDVDADGVPDLSVGDLRWGGRQNGRVEVRSGSTGRILHAHAGDLGWNTHHAVGIGDLDQDGWNDYLLGSPKAGITEGSQGVVQIMSGRDGSELRRHLGGSRWQLGWSLSNLDDINTDGVLDYLCGTSEYAPGRPSRGVVLAYCGATGNEIYRIQGESDWDDFGRWARSIEDLDGDGVRDFLVQADLNSTVDIEKGRVYAFSGSTGALLWSKTGEDDFRHLGWAMDLVPDRDNDGKEDLLLSVGPSMVLPSYVAICSSVDGAELLRIPAPKPDEFEGFGESVSHVGDLNGDGWSEFLVGAWLGAGYSGCAYLFCGRHLNVLYKFCRSSGEVERFGRRVCGCGDFDQDGIPDFAISAHDYSVNDGDRVGAVWVFRGNDLYLQSSTPKATAGETVHFDTRGAAPGDPIVVALVEMDGQGMFLPLEQGVAQGDGTHRTTAVVPPGLTGMTVGLQSFVPSQRKPGKWVDSAVERLILE